MSKRQVAHNLKIEGGFFGMLAGLAAKALLFLAKTVLPTLATGALSGVGSALAQKQQKRRCEMDSISKKSQISQGLKLAGRGCIWNCQMVLDLEMWEAAFISNKGDKFILVKAFCLTPTALCRIFQFSVSCYNQHKICCFCFNTDCQIFIVAGIVETKNTW